MELMKNYQMIPRPCNDLESSFFILKITILGQVSAGGIRVLQNYFFE